MAVFQCIQLRRQKGRGVWITGGGGGGGMGWVQLCRGEWATCLEAHDCSLPPLMKVEGEGQGCSRRGGQKILSLDPLGTEGAKAKFWLSASNI